MRLIPAKDLETVKSKYIEVIDKTPGIWEHARWSYGRHPNDGSLQSYIDNGEMYLLMDGENVAGMVAIVMHQDPDYEAVDWAEPLANDEVAVPHLLAVCPEYQGRALGSLIVKETIDIAKRSGKKAVRLDTLKTNLPAQHMYEKAGFSYRGTQYLYAENTMWVDFVYYEKTLN